LHKHKHVPIIAVTASESAGDRKRAFEVGMDDFTMKPLHPDYLKVILEVMLKKGREKVAKAVLAEKELEKTRQAASRDSVTSAPVITVGNQDSDLGSNSTSIYSRSSLQTGRISVSRMSSVSSKSVYLNSP